MVGINVDGDERIIVYSVQETATPLDPSNTGAAFGQVTYTTTADSAKLLQNVTLNDPEKPWINPANVTELSNTDGLVSVTADTMMSKMNHWFTMLPYSGTLQGYMKQISSLCGMSPTIQVASDIASLPVVAIGYEGNVWEGFKEFLSANKLEAVYDNNQIKIRKPNEDNHVIKYPTTITRNHSAQATAEIVVVKFKELWTPTIQSNIEFYPDHDDYSAGILSVEAGETVIHEIQLDASVVSVNQPVCKDYVAANTSAAGTSGWYSVAGNDGKPIEASRWAAGGGKLEVRTTRDPSVIEVIITGSKVEEYAPYQIAMTAGESSYYNSLHITGRGLRWTEREIEVHTGAPTASTEQETRQEVENRHILTKGQAYNAALQASRALCGGFLTYSGSSAPFGPNVGQRVRLDDAYYRTETTTEVAENKQFELTEHTLISDFNTANPTQTIAQFNSKYSGKRFLDFNERPL